LAPKKKGTEERGREGERSVRLNRLERKGKKCRGV